MVSQIQGLSALQKSFTFTDKEHINQPKNSSPIRVMHLDDIYECDQMEEPFRYVDIRFPSQYHIQQPQKKDIREVNCNIRKVMGFQDKVDYLLIQYLLKVYDLT